MVIPNLNNQDALIVVDVQNDFCPGGKLAVEEGDNIISILNRWMDQANRQGALILASRDWHPEGHVSFKEQGGEWPVHCVQDTEGAEFHPDLKLPDKTWIIDKGDDPNQDQYSAFHKTDLADKLKQQGVKRVWIGGLAEDVCVRQTTLDCLDAGFETHVLKEATRPVHKDRNTIEELKNNGAIIEEDVL